MPWTSLVTEINPALCVGNTLSTINANFENIDYYLENLDTGFDLSDLLLRTNNLSELSSAPSTARTNLEISAGTMSFKDEKTTPQAWAMFDGSRVTTVAGEDLCIVYSNINVSKVIRTTISTDNFRYEIVYTTPLKYVGPIITGGAHWQRTEIITMTIDDTMIPNIYRCRVYPSRIKVLSTDSFAPGQTGRYITVVAF